MFRKKQTETQIVSIELSDASRQALVGLENDIQALAQMTSQLVETSLKIVSALHGEIVAQIPTANESGVRVVEGEPRPALTQAGTPRQRLAPFKRRPRSEQVAWIVGIMRERDWVNAKSLAREHADDTKELRYLHSAIGVRLKEMWEDGLTERRASETPGAMYEYRLKSSG